MPNLRWQELLIIVALVLLLFGAKRLPDAARGLGRSMRIFKAETKGLVDDSADETVDSKSSDQPSALESPSSNSNPAPAAQESAERPSERTDG
jgi:sec-independent protein translocase protein TatA